MPRYTDEGVGCQPCRYLPERQGGAGRARTVNTALLRCIP